MLQFSWQLHIIHSQWLKFSLEDQLGLRIGCADDLEEVVKETEHKKNSLARGSSLKQE
jgi:hypothetical protein